MLSTLLCVTAFAPAPAPGQRYNLSGWKLQTCLQSPREVEPKELADYSDANFFLSDGGAMVMLTPDNAPGITPRASHPRTELRELSVPDWDFGGEHVLRLTTTVLKVSSSSRKTVLAQIHGSADKDERSRLLKLEWADGQVQARVKNASAPFAESGLDCGTYSLGERLEVVVNVTGSVLTVRVNGRTVSYTPPVNHTDRFYFKAGDYNQCSPCTAAGQGAEVHVTALSTSHASMSSRSSPGRPGSRRVLSPAARSAPSVCVEDVPDGLPMSCASMHLRIAMDDATTLHSSCSTLYRMGYQCCPQCDPCGEDGSLCGGSGGSSGSTPFVSIALLGLIFVCFGGVVLHRITAECHSNSSGAGVCNRLVIAPIMAIIMTGIIGVFAGGFIIYLLVTWVVAGAAGTISGNATDVWLAAAATLILLPCLVIQCHGQNERAKNVAAARARLALLKHGPAAKLSRMGQSEKLYFALRPPSRGNAAVLLWWKDAEAWGGGPGSAQGGDPNNGKELGQFDLRGATLSCPPPSRRLELGSLVGKKVTRLVLRSGGVAAAGGAPSDQELVLIFRVGKEDAAAAEWETALRRALALGLAPPPARAAPAAPAGMPPPPRIPVVTGTPVEPPPNGKALELM